MKLAVPVMLPARRRSRDAFTLIEIALCLAIVAFALVAIIGVLPTGMEVQRDNRQDTLVNQDGPLLTEAIRNATTNLALLTNNLEWIELFSGTNALQSSNFIRRVYATNLTPKEMLGTICTPKFLDFGVVYTNTTRAKFRSVSGPMANEATNAQDMAFNYLLTVEVVPLRYHISPAGADPAVTAATVTNLWELRLAFEWPVIRDSTNNVLVGSSRRVFRSLVGARLLQEDQTNSLGVVTNTLWFFTPDAYAAN
jgi:type II secretory pathway pseudopilin PulG